MRIEYDAIVIGGGFYGCSVAITLADRLSRVLLVEREAELLTRASYANQARVHNGYHYPRSLLTAIRSAANYPEFTSQFEDCVDRSFLHIYAIARGSSKVSAYQFRRFCQQVQIPVRPVPDHLARQFNSALIEEAVAVEESTFDAVKLRTKVRSMLQQSQIETACGCETEKVTRTRDDRLSVVFGDGRECVTKYVFNCTYSQINQLLIRSGLSTLPLKHELAELALVDVPPILKNVGITVMDGPYFSTIPFTSLGLHTLSHVTYTPHHAWSDMQGKPQSIPPDPPSKSLFMIKDAQRYLPILREARYVKSLFETKTVLLRNEVDDGRPILCCRHEGAEGLFAILGAKIDNIYDIIRTLNLEEFTGRTAHVASC